MSDDTTRDGFVDLAVTAVTTAAVLPFVQAIATKAGEDVWPKIAELVRARRRERIEERIPDTDVIELVARDRRTVIRMPTRMSAEQARHLHDVVESLEGTEDWHRLTYDAAARTWVVTAADGADRRLIEGATPDD